MVNKCFSFIEFLIFKIFIIIYFNVKNKTLPFNNLSKEAYYDLEIYIVEGQSWLHIVKMFLPNSFVFLNSIFGFMKQQNISYQLKYSEIKMSKQKVKLINFLMILILGLLIGLQAFNFGIISYFFQALFIIYLVLYFRNEKQNYKYILFFIQVNKFFCCFVLLANYMVSTKTFQKYINSEKYTFFFIGINHLYSFQTNLIVKQKKNIYFIYIYIYIYLYIHIYYLQQDNIIYFCFLFFTCLLLFKIADFVKFDLLLIEIINQTEQIQKKINQINFNNEFKIKIQEDDDQQKIQNQEFVSYQQTPIINIGIFQEENIIYQEQKELQIQELMHSENSGNEQKQVQLKQQKINFQTKIKQFMKLIYLGFTQFLKNFKSLIFILRFLQITTMILCQRYQSYYSLGLLLWILLTGLTINHNFTRISTLLMAIPSVFLTQIFLVFANLKDNQIVPHWANNYLGFQKVKFVWIEIIILNASIFFFYLYCIQVKKYEAQKIKEKMQKNSGVKFGIQQRKKNKKQKDIISLFLLYFTNMNKLIKVKNEKYSNLQKNCQNQQQMVLHQQQVEQENQFQQQPNLLENDKSNQLEEQSSDIQEQKDLEKLKHIQFGRRYWIILVIYVEMFILARYVYFLIFQQYIIDKSDSYNLIYLIGINYKYSLFKFGLGFKSDDFASESIIWILFFFIILQYDSYKSKIYLKYSHKINTILSKKPLIQKIFPQYIDFVEKQKQQNNFYQFFLQKKKKDKFNILFNSNLDFFYFDFRSFNINLIFNYQQFCFAHNYDSYSILCYSLRVIDFKFCQIQAVLVLIFLTFLRYFLQLTGKQYIKDHIIINFGSWYSTFQLYRHSIGLYQDTDDKQLRYKFLPNVMNIFMAVLVLDYFRLMSRGHKVQQQLQQIHKNENILQPQNKQSLSQLNISFSRQQSRKMSILSENSIISDFEIENKIENQNEIQSFKIYQKYLLIDMQKEFPFIQLPMKFIAKFFTDLMSFLVVIFAVNFKISISMFYFLVIYMYFYYKTHSGVLRYIEQNKFYEQISTKMFKYKHQFLLISQTKYKEQKNQEKLENQEKKRQKVEQQIFNEENHVLLENINYLDQLNQSLRIETKLNVWAYSFIGSTIFLILTYLSSFLLSPIAVQYFYQVSLWIQWFSFILGTQITVLDNMSNTFRNIYFYFLIFWLNVIDWKCLFYLKDQLDKFKGPNQSVAQKNFENENNYSIQNQSQLIQLENSEISLTSEQISSQNYYNILNYYKYSTSYIQMKLMFSTLFIIQRFYILLILFNSEIKGNAYSWIYLILACFFWVRIPKSSNIRSLNTWSILIVLFQYVFFLLNINQDNSLIQIPENLLNLKSFSVIQIFFKNNIYENYLGFNSKEKGTFVVNSIIIFLIEIYQTYFIAICLVIINKISEKTVNQQKKYDYKIWINFQSWKKISYKIYSSIYRSKILYIILYFQINYKKINSCSIKLPFNSNYYFYRLLLLRIPNYKYDNFIHVLRIFLLL
ncbi:hypothetical protein IMG5_203780 [Ichthyophthirius multifiliis]|uniref:Uncharacterized protein n=1 Tax=Ichthyophthirius multifiliis TaxID=5932 RepID=G0R6D3_ICHMU|nr:hypothetical protein IMG5_203780 [Ichthyophthirius multifiliis]EGR26979.1 hypothetical protein IMG5_203780 [Ichthyophthirius multifiliis]|eukprot:XP_004023863.1 hypothetical protein IMG5_203780 [Ichthyophthirius multifiliis]